MRNATARDVLLLILVVIVAAFVLKWVFRLATTLVAIVLVVVAALWLWKFLTRRGDDESR